MRNIVRSTTVLGLAAGLFAASYQPVSAESLFERVFNVPVAIVQGALEVPARVIVEVGKGDLVSVVTSPLYAIPGAANGATRIVCSAGHVVDESMRYDRELGEDGYLRCR